MANKPIISSTNNSRSASFPYLWWFDIEMMDTTAMIEQIHKRHEHIGPEEKKRLFKDLLYSEERSKEGCVLIQAGGFVIGGNAFLITGTGTINILESIAQFSEVEGIVGNGNALFLSRDFTRIYSTLDEEESLYCYESRLTGRRMPYMYSAMVWPIIFLQRAFKNHLEYEHFRHSQPNVWLANGNEFLREQVNFRSRYRSRLKNKFVKTCQVVHCCHRPTMQPKEMLYDDPEMISEAVDNFIGRFILGYTLYSRDLEKILGFSNFVKWKNNPSEKMAYIILKSCFYLLSQMENNAVLINFEPHQLSLTNNGAH